MTNEELFSQTIENIKQLKEVLKSPHTLILDGVESVLYSVEEIENRLECQERFLITYFKF